MKGLLVWSLSPLEILILISFLPSLKGSVFFKTPPPPPELSSTFPWRGMDIIWNRTFYPMSTHYEYKLFTTAKPSPSSCGHLTPQLWCTIPAKIHG